MADGSDTFTQIPTGPPNYQDFLQELLGSLGAPAPSYAAGQPVGAGPAAAPVPAGAVSPPVTTTLSGSASMPNYASLAPWVQAAQVLPPAGSGGYTTGQYQSPVNPFSYAS